MFFWGARCVERRLPGSVRGYRGDSIFYRDPEVYILIIPGFGIISQIVSRAANQPIFGALGMIYAMVSIGILGFVVWAYNKMGLFFCKKKVKKSAVCKNTLRALSSKVVLYYIMQAFDKTLKIGQFASNILNFTYKCGTSETIRTHSFF